MNSPLKKIVSENLKNIMAKLQISHSKLAERAGISRYQVDNLLYCRALNTETLHKVSAALNIRIEHLTSSEHNHVSSVDFDLKVYSQIISSIQKILEDYKLTGTKFLIERIANALYKNYSSFDDIDEAAKGIICFLLETDPDLKKIKFTA